MKKQIFSGFLACFVLLAVNARAEHKLLVTEVLDAGQVEAQATYEIVHAETDFDVPAFAESGELKLNLQESRYSLGVGLGHKLELSASIPYVISEKAKLSFDAMAPESEEADGFGDLTLGAKYRIFEEEHLPFTLAIGVDVKLDTASEGDVGTGTTDVSPYLALSKEVAEHVEGYAVYRATLVDSGGSDEHALALGVEAELNEALTLDAALQFGYNTSDDETDSFETYGLELAAYLQVAHNLYLIPAFGIERATAFDMHFGTEVVNFDPTMSYRGALSVYFLY